MARLHAVHQGGAAFNIECRGHTVVCDQPVDNGGENAGMTPPELFAGSIAGCIGFYVAKYCQSAGISTEALDVSCDWETVDDPRRIGTITVDVTLPALPEKRKKAVARVAAACLIHATLMNPPEFTINIHGTVDA